MQVIEHSMKRENNELIPAFWECHITNAFKKMSIIPKIMPTEFYNLHIFLLS